MVHSQGSSLLQRFCYFCNYNETIIFFICVTEPCLILKKSVSCVRKHPKNNLLESLKVDPPPQSTLAAEVSEKQINIFYLMLIMVA
jgi:hypothetical protein